MDTGPSTGAPGPPAFLLAVDTILIHLDLNEFPALDLKALSGP
jgi:hypothetical protein